MEKTNETLKKTVLYEKHKEAGGKLVPFAGFEMPIVYSSIMEEHKCVRNGVGVFDVSHMGEFKITGDKALDLIQKVTINDASKLEPGKVQYSAMCYPDGGIVDDLLVYMFEDHYMLVVNASNIEKDLAWIMENKMDGAEVENISDDITLIAVQGPKSIDVVQKMCSLDLSELKYYNTLLGKTADCPGIISRTGYTGEIGFELYVKNEYGEKIWDILFDAGKEYGILPIGLGARDTLRLEKNMCLYGNDITKDSNPIEAGLGWITKLDKDDFIAKNVLASVKENKPDRKLVGFELEGRGIPRHGYKIQHEGAEVGEVTSGGFSPILEKGIGMGYVRFDLAKVGNKIDIDVRGKLIPAEIIKPPFVK